MLELIGIVAILYLAFKLLPGFIMFLVKLTVGIIVLFLFVSFLFWILAWTNFIFLL